MAHYDWPGFYEALCRKGPQVLAGIDDETRGIISLATETDAFWSEGLQEVLAEAAERDDLGAGVLAAVDLWRENVLTVLSEDYGIEMEWDEVTVDASHCDIDALVIAATAD